MREYGRSALLLKLLTCRTDNIDIKCCVVLCCVVLCCVVLCCVVLCCIVLCCVVLCCTQSSLPLFEAHSKGSEQSMTLI
jgi:hypothetical protein